jgi:chemotaxis protein methyltransferase CheR
MSLDRSATRSEALIADPDFASTKAEIVAATGLAYYRDKDADLAEKVGRRMTALRLASCAAYLALLRDEGAGSAEFDELVAELTIGETYFFRHEEQFDALRDTVVPRLLERNAARRQIRIWSAGCATGAELYSISILLRRHFGPLLSGWDVGLLGTDINRRFLAQARDGVFGDWALRRTDDALREACFERTSGSWRVRETYRAGVSFQFHNLVKHPYPSLLHNLAAFDLIVCRNVMIYFDRAVIGECVQRFRSSLVDGGWLVVGHAEMDQESFQSFRAWSTTGTVLYERTTEPPAPRADLASVTPPPPPPWRPPLWHAPASSSSRETVPTVESAPVPIVSGAARIRELADGAQWEEALALCAQMIDEDRLNPLGHFYHGLVLDQTGQADEAERALRRALYLDRGFVLAHYHCGLLLQKRNDVPGAVRSFRNVVDLLGTGDGDRRLDEADGISAADLAELAMMQISVLETP